MASEVEPELSNFTLYSVLCTLFCIVSVYVQKAQSEEAPPVGAHDSRGVAEVPPPPGQPRLPSLQGR